MHKDFSLGDIDTYIKSLDEHGVTCGGMTCKTIGNVLDLKTTPNFRYQNHKKYFYSFKLEKYERDHTTVQE